MADPDKRIPSPPDSRRSPKGSISLARMITRSCGSNSPCTTRCTPGAATEGDERTREANYGNWYVLGLLLETLPHGVGKALQTRQMTGQPLEKRGISLGRIVDELIANPDQAGQFPSHISL